MKVKTKYLYTGSSIAILVILLIIILPKGTSDSYIKSKAHYGTFKGVVFTSGQLQANQSITINAPEELSAQFIQVNDIEITSLVEEGTAVDSGDFVASLDHAAVSELIKKANEELEKAQSELNDAKADTSINLTNLRDELLNANVTLEEKKLIADQSIYESPSVVRQAKLDVERSQRDLEQKVRNYDLKVQQEAHKVFKAKDKYRREQQKVDNFNKLYNALEITAPSAGIVIYSFDRMGSKIKVGSKVSRYSPQIAELPDLRTLTSKTFINEVDISQVSIGQKVKVGVDAFPDKQFTGTVTNVANIGQVIPGGDAKVFEASIRIDGSDPLLKPGMTTNNRIITHAIDSVLYIPLESVFTLNNTSVVYADDNGSIIIKEVKTGAENENYIIIEKGLEKDETVLMNSPDEIEKLEYIPLND